MEKQVLFIHCGGSQSPQAGSSNLVHYLRDRLGTAYTVLYPEMPDPEHPAYETWKRKLEHVLASLNHNVLLVGHSLGASVLLKYLSEEACAKSVAGLYLIAPPFWGAKNWHVAEYALTDDFQKNLAHIGRIFLYHSRNDEVVPFNHLLLYAGMLPNAVVRALDSGGHLFGGGLSQLVQDIRED